MRQHAETDFKWIQYLAIKILFKFTEKSSLCLEGC